MRTHIRFTEQLSVEKLVPGYVERRVSWVLGRFARIGTVTVKLSGRGPDAVRPLTCRMSADIQPFGTIAAAATNPDVFRTIDRWVGRLARRCEAKTTRLNNRATIRGQAA